MKALANKRAESFEQQHFVRVPSTDSHTEIEETPQPREDPGKNTLEPVRPTVAQVDSQEIESAWRLDHRSPEREPKAPCVTPPPARECRTTPVSEIPLGFAATPKPATSSVISSSSSQKTRAEKYDAIYHQCLVRACKLVRGFLRIFRYCKQRKTGPKASAEVLKLWNAGEEGSSLAEFGVPIRSAKEISCEPFCKSTGTSSRSSSS